MIFGEKTLAKDLNSTFKQQNTVIFKRASRVSFPSILIPTLFAAVMSVFSIPTYEQCLFNKVTEFQDSIERKTANLAKKMKTRAVTK